MFIESLLTTQARTCWAAVQLSQSTASTLSKAPLLLSGLIFVSLSPNHSLIDVTNEIADVARILKLGDAHELQPFFKGCLTIKE